MATSDYRYFGIDGCQSGWVIVAATEDLLVASCWCETSIAPILERIASGVVATIDIPIGLPDREPRRCDVQARKFLGRKGSSVFPTPSRASLAAKSYADCCEVNKKAMGVALSRQSHALLDKIREVDTAVDVELQERLWESHPEVLFAVLAERPLNHSKKTVAGQIERYKLLRQSGLDLMRMQAVDVLNASPDDLLDAAACVVAAHRIATGKRKVFGDAKRDARGLRMEISA